MKQFAAFGLPILLVALGLGLDDAKDSKAPEKKELKCPISNKPVNPEVSLNINGEPLYFCCEKCVAAYKTKVALEPAAEKDGAKVCVLSGEKADPSKTLIHKKVQEVSFCCNNCRGAYAKEHKVEFKPGTGKCPLSKKDADPATAIVVNGETIAFCCMKCQAQYKKTELAGLAPANEGKCPKSGKAADPTTAIVLISYSEKTFCCGNCQKKYIKENFTKKDEEGKDKEKGEKSEEPKNETEKKTEKKTERTS